MRLSRVIACLAVASGAASVTPASAATLPVWPAASEFSTLPPGASTTPGQQEAELDSVACTSPGNCVAVGSYTDANLSGENYLAMVTTETGGVWGPASQLTLPSGADMVAGEHSAALDSVACTSPGNCVAVGSYEDTDGEFDYRPMVATETGGVWAQATELTLPSDAETTPGEQNAGLGSVTCTSPGNCVAVGHYANEPDNYQTMVATETSGVWAQASELTPPPGAVADQEATLDSVTCASPGNCVAGGSYADGEGGDLQPMLVTESGGVWSQASELTLPAGANTTVGERDDSLDSVTCTSPGNCIAAGSYEDTNGSRDDQAMLVAESGGVWGQASELTLPAGANTTAGEQNAGLLSLTCTSSGSCVAVGRYEDSSDDEQAMVLSSVASLALSTSSLPFALTTVAYNAQLSATGGAGSYTWSLSSGSLPPGLSLNAATGVISGTPTAGGTFSFTIAVSDPGPPGQRASAALSIRVGVPAAFAPAPTRPAPTRTTAHVGNQLITLTTPSPLVCTTPTHKLAVTFKSTRIPKSKGAKLRFSSVAFYIDKGVKHTHHKTERTRSGTTRRVTVTIYEANARAHSTPVALALSLAGPKAGTHTLKVVVFYRETTRSHGHKKVVTVTKTLRVKFSVC